ncbi:5-methylcytosine restriction system specificity protein McrC [Nannocystis punicea]|uniref:5-methylcytosine-specific restriction enzyme subunit McrC n=1 Tax=Nannocystis punicea TaxID=2995304 RepID=A0ABY7HBC8_9BACT|nr:hypothetical protein [Nannocystis poenicansa]WAS96408.1 hypothetical protein O0S08_09635 [Nannocystis poenicansa]
MSGVLGDHGIPVRNAWYLLLYAWDLAAFAGGTRAAVEEAPSLLGLLARVLVDATGRLLQRRLAHRHQPRVELVRGIRGRIDFTHTLAGLQLQAGRTTCRFSALTLDTPPNRVLRATLARLADDPRLAPAVPGPLAVLRADLRAQVRAMEGVPLVAVSAQDFSRLQLGRNDEAYILPLSICRLVYDLRMPTEAAGDHAVHALLRDEVHFRRLFERFVRNFWRTHATAYDVRCETLQWHDELESAYVPTMTTDITLTERAAPHRRVVVDTKFARHTLVRSLHGPLRFRTENLYQLYTYLRTQEHRSQAHRDAGGLLLYPTTEREVEEAMRVQGHTIRVATVDLSASWPDVEARLMAVLARVFPD